MIMSVPPSMAIDVDGIKSVGEWDEDWNWNQTGEKSFPIGNRLAMWQQGIELDNDPKNDSGPDYDDSMAQAGESSGYDIMRFYSAYDAANDTAYGLVQVYGLPADLDGDLDPDNDCVAFGDCDGISVSEIIIIRFKQESLGTNIRMDVSNNTVTVDNPALVDKLNIVWNSDPDNFIEDPDDTTQPRAVYEFSLEDFTSSGLFSRDADDSPIEIELTAGGLEDIPGEDKGRAFLWFPTPKIDIEKYVQDTADNWLDADSPWGPKLVNGTTAYWKYVVTNTGDDYLIDVAVDDDIIGPITCPQTTLNVGESMTCFKDGPIPDDCPDYKNWATVEGYGAVSGIRVTDEDPAHYYCRPDVPALTPAGLMALIGILGMIGIVGLKRRD